MKINTEDAIEIPSKSIIIKEYLKTTNFQIICSDLDDYTVLITRNKITTQIDEDGNEEVVDNIEIENINAPLNDLLTKFPMFSEIYSNIDTLLDETVYEI